MGRGSLFGVGVGPGDPDLLTLKAVYTLQQADVVAYFSKAGSPSHARRSVDRHLKPGVSELPLEYPVTTEIPKHEPAYREAIDGFFDASAARIAELLDSGKSVAVLSEGDPFFYGSYLHLHVRLARAYPTEVIPGVTSPSGCWSQAGLPIASGDDVLMVLPATLSEEELVRRLREADAAVILKLGRHLPKVRRALERASRLGAAFYVERGTMLDASLARLHDRTSDRAPYFSLVLVPGVTESP